VGKTQFVPAKVVGEHIVVLVKWQPTPVARATLFQTT